MQNFSIFETNRAQNGGGGLLTAVHETFNPALLQTDQDSPDVLIVECTIGANSVNLINGYGPQETDSISNKMEFFTCFETAIQRALLNDSLICAELDANSKIGMENISGDPHHISANGQLLMNIVRRNGLIVVNSTEKCGGLITRVRNTKISEEKSILDYFIVCPKFYEIILKMDIDESRKYVITKYSTRMGVKSVCEIRLDNKIQMPRKEVFKLKHSMK